MAGLWKCSKIGTLWGKMGQIFALVVVRIMVILRMER